jgi:hypothetical protein
MTAQLHLAVDTLALQLLLERAQRLLDIIVANDDLHTSPVTLLEIVPCPLKYLKTLTFSLSGTTSASGGTACGDERPLAALEGQFNPPTKCAACGEPWSGNGQPSNKGIWVMPR